MAAALLLSTPALSEAPQPGGTLTAIIQPEPVILTAAINTAAPTGTISGNVFDGLVDYDTDPNYPVCTTSRRFSEMAALTDQEKPARVADSSEIEVTQEMIEAGIDPLLRFAPQGRH